MPQMNFNPDQLTTIEEAREFASMVSSRTDLFPTAVAPEDQSDDWHNDQSGIYLAPWANPTGDNPEPAIGDSRPFLLRFNPVQPSQFQPAGFNIGLSRTVAKGHSAHDDNGVWLGEYNWDYALKSLSAEVKAQVAAASPSDS